MDSNISVQNEISQETERSLTKFPKASEKPKAMYSDNSLEFNKASEESSWEHYTSTPHRSETNGIAERTVLCLLCSCNLYWTKSCGQILRSCHFYLQNITPTSGRTGQHIANGDLVNLSKDRYFLLVLLVKYHTISAKDQSRLHQFWKKDLPRIFLGNALFAGRIWQGDILVVDLEELENLGAPEIRSKTQCEGGDDAERW